MEINTGLDYEELKPISKKKALTINTISGITYQGILFIVALVIPRLILQMLGSNINGLSSAITQVVSYLYLLEAGLSYASTYALYKPIVEDDKFKIQNILFLVTKKYKKLILISFLIIILSAWIYPLIINRDGLTINYINVVVLYIIIGIAAILDYFILSKYRILLIADNRNYIIYLSSALQQLIYLGIAIVILYFFNNGASTILLVRGIALLSITAKIVIVVFYSKKKYPFINDLKEDKNLEINQINYAFIGNILYVIGYSAPLIIISIILNLESVSIYSVYYIVVLGINSVINTIVSSFDSIFGKLIKEHHTRLSMYAKIIETYFIIGITIILSVTFIQYNSFIKLYTANIEDSYIYDNSFLGYLFTIYLLTLFYSWFYRSLSNSAGLFKDNVKRYFVFAFGNVLLPLTLIYFYHIEGVVVGMIITNILYLISTLILIPKKLNFISVKNTIKLLLTSSLSFYITILINKFIKFDINSFQSWIKSSFLIFILNSFLIFLIFVIFHYKTIIDSIKIILTNIRK